MQPLQGDYIPKAAHRDIYHPVAQSPGIKRGDKANREIKPAHWWKRDAVSRVRTVVVNVVVVVVVPKLNTYPLCASVVRRNAAKCHAPGRRPSQERLLRPRNGLCGRAAVMLP